VRDFNIADLGLGDLIRPCSSVVEVQQYRAITPPLFAGFVRRIQKSVLD
jgi:hypothetical protein